MLIELKKQFLKKLPKKTKQLGIKNRTFCTYILIKFHEEWVMLNTFNCDQCGIINISGVTKNIVLGGGEVKISWENN